MHQFSKLRTVFFISVLAMSSLGYAVYAAAADNNTVVAILQFSFSNQEVIPSQASKNTVGAFEVYRHTQATLLKSSFVLRSALVRRNIASLKVVQGHEPDPLPWLKKALEIELPKNSELIVLRLSDSGDSKQLKKILDAVIAAHRQEVLGSARIREHEAIDTLEQFYRSNSKEYRTKLDTYIALSSELEVDGNVATSGALEMLKFELEVQRDFLKELSRELMIVKMNAQLNGSLVRIIQQATVVKE